MDPALFAERRVGTTLRGKWTLEKLLGTGGMAAVYVGVHKIGQRAAIKILHPDIARSPELRARFEQEAHAVNRFKHPGVVEIRDIDVAEDGAPFLVMELLDGRSLADHMGSGNRLPLDEVLRLVDELLDVLVAAHAQGIVHRDIKPDNLFITREGRLKVLDFGIARVKDGMADLRTRAGAMLGTAPYMAPEQIRGGDIDARVDVFAVGATMFRLFTGRRIHEASSEPELLVKMATMPAPPLLSVAPGVPPAVGCVVDRALAMDREQRYPDAATMQRDVRALRTAAAPSPAPPREAAPANEATDRTVAAAPNALLAAAAASAEGPQGPPPSVVVTDKAADPSARTVVALPPVAVAVAAATPPERMAQAPIAPQRKDEKTPLILLLGVIAVLLLVLVVIVLLRPPAAGEAGAPAPLPTDDPGARPARDPGNAQPMDADPPWSHPGKGKGKGHGWGKRKHKGDEDD